MSSVVTESLVYPATVTVPDDVDDLNAASVTDPGVGFQALTDRSNNLAERCGGTTGIPGEFTYLGAAGTPNPKARVRILSPFQIDTHTGQTANGDQSWYAELGRRLSSINNLARLSIDLNQVLPHLAVVTDIRVVVKPGAARTVQSSLPGDNGRMWTRLFRGTPNFAGPGATAFGADISAVEDDGTTNVQLLVNGSMGQAINKGLTYLIWQLIAGDDAGTNRDDIEAVEISYLDPGPLNL